MLKIRTVCFAFLIPLLLELLVYCTPLSPCADREIQITRGSEKAEFSFQRLDTPRETEENKLSFGGLQTASLLCIMPMEFQTLEPAALHAFELPVQAMGWMMPLRI
ncbi:hypothetical protein P4E94_05900 [Pontiellaceae bacterium B12219]|nr:hypothetical protein [Pontiellaceae bacterium B12219]